MNRDYLAALRAFATRAAQNTESPLVEVMKRPKSQAYLFGRLVRKFPDADHEELRETIIRFRWLCADDPDAHTVPEKDRRPPSRGREPLSSPKWNDRIQRLQAIIDVPMTTEELFLKARREFGWSSNFFTAVISAADGRGVMFYGHPYWKPTKHQTLPTSRWAEVARRLYQDKLREWQNRTASGPEKSPASSNA